MNNDAAASNETLVTLAMEYANMRCGMEHCPLGVYIVPSESLLQWDGVMFIHQGYYANSILKFRMTFPWNFPARPPSVHFVTDVFHPLVSQRDGMFSLAPQFHSWRPKEHHVFDVLHFLKSAFKKHQLDQFKEKDCLNKDAFRYHDATSSFAALAMQTSALSNSMSALYDRDHPPPSSKGRDGLPFSEVNQNDLRQLREKLGLKEWETKDFLL